MVCDQDFAICDLHWQSCEHVPPVSKQLTAPPLQLNGKVNGKVNGLNGEHKVAAVQQQHIQGPDLLDFLKKRRSVYPKDFSGEPVSRCIQACSTRRVM